MIKIKEIIVVEGKDDINAVKRAVDAEMIVTSGMGINEKKLKEIEAASRRCGIIVLTDPDYPGERIRSIISQRVEGCKHAYLTQSQARCKSTGKIGIEYANPEDIKEALVKAKAEQRVEDVVHTSSDLLQWGLTGSPRAANRRLRLGKILGIGKTNAKQFLHRLNSFNISKSEIENALIMIEGLE